MNSESPTRDMDRAYAQALAERSRVRDEWAIFLFVGALITLLLTIFGLNRDVLQIWGWERGLPIVLGYRIAWLAPFLGLHETNAHEYATGVYWATKLGGDPSLNKLLQSNHTYGFDVYEKVGKLHASGISLCDALSQAGVTTNRGKINKAVEGLSLGLQGIGIIAQLAGGDIFGAIMAGAMTAGQIPSAIHTFERSCLTLN